MAAGREKTLAQSRSRDQIYPSRMDKYAIFFQNGGKEKGERNLGTTTAKKQNGIPRGNLMSETKNTD